MVWCARMAVVVLVALGAGCTTIPSSVVVEQATSESLNATAARALASSIEVNYTGPAKEADTVAINAGLAADVADRYGKVDAAAYNAWYDAAKAKADAAIAAKAAEHDAITAQLEAIAARSESNAKIAKEIAKKVNGE